MEHTDSQKLLYLCVSLCHHDGAEDCSFIQNWTRGAELIICIVRIPVDS
jgi:hypothetical protein